MTIKENFFISENAHGRTATVYCVLRDKHICAYEIKPVDLLNRKGFEGEDNCPTTREQTDAFKAK